MPYLSSASVHIKQYNVLAIVRRIVDRLTNRTCIEQAREEQRVQLLTMMLFGEIYKLYDIILLRLRPTLRARMASW